MKLQFKQTTTSEVEVDLPKFYMNDMRGYAFLETGQISFFVLGDHVSVAQTAIAPLELSQCIESGNEVTEAEFLARYEQIVKGLSLIPTLKKC